MTVTIHAEVNTYRDVCERLTSSKTRHLLLGNGFSIGCDPVFTYGSLYDAAVQAGLGERAQVIFSRMGTNNFEGVMRLLDDSHFVAATYGLVSEQRSDMLDDLEMVKKALVEAVAHSHLPHTGAVPDEKKAAAAHFIAPYQSVFSTNYDLLLYWVNMAAADRPPFGDGFREDDADPDAPSLVFSEKLGSAKGIYYLHGGLHLFTQSGALRKHCWRRSHKPLIELILEALAKGGYPLFVAEGTPEKKLEQIRSNAYLSYALGKLSRIESPLVIYGHALGRSDSHITDTITNNEKIKAVYVGLFGDPDSEANGATRHAAEEIALRWRQRSAEFRRPPTLDLFFFDSASVGCWG